MKKYQLTFIFLLFIHILRPCSMYKVTKNGVTIVGCNEDAWRITPHIWFEIGTNTTLGAAFTGSRYDGQNGYAPQSGMNEYGLVFSRLASYHPKIQTSIFDSKLQITNPTQYLKNILHTCKTVDEVKNYIQKYDQSFFLEDVFIYIEKSGKYIIVEPYTIITGNDCQYVLSNFCPSITSSEKAEKLERYRNGVHFLKNKLETDLDFCKKVSDTMHVCRDKIGDGTLLTSIWNTNEGIVNLYFYHNYSTTVQFNLQEELSKGNHSYQINQLFPKNKEFESLEGYKIPHNTNSIRFILLSFGLFFICSSFYFLFSYFKRRNQVEYNFIKLILFFFGLFLFYYMYVLNTTISIFYFPSPYHHSSNTFITMSSYIPYVLAISILPFLYINYKLALKKSWNVFTFSLFSLNNLIYLFLIAFFTYWMFYFTY
ncbi:MULTISPECIES: hypothetical protein [unclassified Flavobacterium]|uniref:hypothetical protein n=1 Tax=unclassified Flavobacterium TaxID=196869 RepID=UPI0020916AF2|nr:MULTISPECIES: hypothetical protein [unclassified Flavobacterium]MCO6163186.1 hypothetical protein [Flavobacterium sp. NRK F7]